MTQAEPEASFSSYLGGKLNIFQPIKGYRAAIDPALLAASLPLKPEALAVEFGCGVGAAMLSAAVLNPTARFLGIERDPGAARLAHHNVMANDLSTRIRVKKGDITDQTWAKSNQDTAKLIQDRVKADPSTGSQLPIDAIFFNPPFFDDAAALRAPDPTRTGAWINDTTLADWITLGLRRLREGGTLTLIQRADRLGDILSALAPKSGGVKVLPVHPKADAPAKRVIVSAIKTSKAPLQLLPGLVLHTSDGRFTPEADAILRGEAKTALAAA
jgi:tRNA1(Val) A37 N6-methylase TrmN6